MLNEPDNTEMDDPDEITTNQFSPFKMMEGLLEKLKLLDYEQHYCRRMRLKGFSKVQFAIQTHPGEQFNSFVTLSAWLIGKCGGEMEQPQEYDDPNATIASVLESLRGLGYPTEFPPSKLKSGCGEQCIRVLDLLAGEAVKHTRLRFDAPSFSDGESDDPEVQQSTHSDDDEYLVEWTGRKSKISSSKNNPAGFTYDSETDAEALDDDEAVLDLDGCDNTLPHKQEAFDDIALIDDNIMDQYGPFGSLLTQTNFGGALNPQITQKILESDIDRGDWQLEVERVLPQLRVAIRTESKDWRGHLEQMIRHRNEIESSFKESRSHLLRLHEDLTRGLDKINSRERYMNSQVENLLKEYRCAKDQLSEMKEKYKLASGGITERSRILADLTDELDRVKQEMEQRGSSMTDGSPVVRIKQAIQRLKAEIIAMDIRTGVLEHTLLRMQIHAREESQKPLFTRYTVGAGLETEYAF